MEIVQPKPPATQLNSTAGGHPIPLPGVVRFFRHPATSFLLPAVTFLFALTIYPFIYSVISSFLNFSLTDPRPSTFAGFSNYLNLFADNLFSVALLNTGLITVASVGIEFLIGFCMAHLFIAISDLRGAQLLRTIYILPMMVTPVVVGLLWSYILDPLFGIMNYLLGLVGIAPQPWFPMPIPLSGRSFS